MPSRLHAISIAAFVAMLAAPAVRADGLTVRFEAPDRYTDAAPGAYQADYRRALAIIEQHLRGLAARCLAPGDALDIRVLDIDLAGRQEWWRRSGASGARVMRDITRPRIDVAYAYRRGGTDAVEARERISNMNYLMDSARVRADSQPLPYERAMLTTWFERRFC